MASKCAFRDRQTSIAIGVTHDFALQDGIKQMLFLAISRLFSAGRSSESLYGTGQGGSKISKVNDLHKKWSGDPDYRVAYEGLGPEFELARSLIEARTRAGLTQEQLARRMKTSQSVIARWESGRTRPSTKTLEKLAKATSTRLKISFEATDDAA